MAGKFPRMWNSIVVLKIILTACLHAKRICKKVKYDTIYDIFCRE